MVLRGRSVFAVLQSCVTYYFFKEKFKIPSKLVLQKFHGNDKDTTEFIQLKDNILRDTAEQNLFVIATDTISSLSFKTINPLTTNVPIM